MNYKSHFLFLGFISALSINSAFALPIDWTGVFGVDSHMLTNTCRTSDADTKNPTAPNGTQALAQGDCDATFQTYTLRLNPSIIVNDGVTLNGELSTGHFRGNFLGSDSANNQDSSGNNSYFFTTPAQRSSINVNQMYMEIYADTALVKIGRMSRHFGMGMIFDNGNDAWDRFFTMYDGIQAEMKVGNFSFIPHYAKLSNYNDDISNSDAREASGALDVREVGLIAKYDNKNRDLVASVLYAKRSSERRNALYIGNDTPNPTGTHDRGKTDITVIEPYLSKRWSKLRVSFEASLQSGDYGNVYGDGKSKLDALAYVGEIKYDLNPKWDVGFIAGQASGDDGSTDKFEASYLHPNFHIADLMFRYNYAGINEGGRSIFDSSISNARFFKLYGNYKSDNWTWKGAFIMANALETAKTGKDAYHHEENYRYTANFDQDDDYGLEVDLGVDYRWNPNVTVSAYYAYWKVGDYYSFTNTAGTLSLTNVHGGGFKATLEF